MKQGKQKEQIVQGNTQEEEKVVLKVNEAILDHKHDANHDMLINDINMDPKGAKKLTVAMDIVGTGHKNKVTMIQDKKQKRQRRPLKTRRCKLHKKSYKKKRIRKGKEKMVLFKKLRDSNGNEDGEVLGFSSKMGVAS
ncbi:unnamed protein product [Ilex paraguariensis]|uniref:Uncharacterized protein n=1 Tax=Ilex paraguariensis TaxID=185542 RepID=A0ABC8TP95_9AQUA